MWRYYNLLQSVVLHLVQKTSQGPRVHRQWDRVQPPLIGWWQPGCCTQRSRPNSPIYSSRLPPRFTACHLCPAGSPLDVAAGYVGGPRRMKNRWHGQPEREGARPWVTSSFEGSEAANRSPGNIFVCLTTHRPGCGNGTTGRAAALMPPLAQPSLLSKHLYPAGAGAASSELGWPNSAGVPSSSNAAGASSPSSPLSAGPASSNSF